MRYAALFSLGLSLLLLAPPAHADGRLLLEASAEPAEVRAGEALRLTATFRNVGDAPLELYLPEHLGHVIFPRWVLRHEDGRRFAPQQASFQSMWPDGLMGSILTLEAGAARAFTTEVRRVHAVGPDAAQLEVPQMLPAGRYAVRAEYAQEDDRVPWALPNFRVEKRVHEGLWTGTAQSPSTSLTVTPSGRPELRIVAPEEAKPGAPYPLRLEIVHTGEEPVRIRGALVVRVHSKAYGGGHVRLLLRDTDWLRARADDQVHEVTFQPLDPRVVELDLAAVDLVRQVHLAGGKAWRVTRAGLCEVIPSGLFHLSAVIEVEGAEKPLASAGMFRRMQELAPGPVAGLSLRLELGSSALPAIRVAVVLRNDGDAPVHVPAHLSYPRHVFFSLLRPGEAAQGHYRVTQKASASLLDLMNPDEPGSRARIQDGSSWDGERYEEPPPLHEQSFVRLAPGAEIRRVFDLADLIAGDGDLGHGAWVLRAFWRNRESGRRLGLEPPLVTGMLASPPLEVHGRVW